MTTKLTQRPTPLARRIQVLEAAIRTEIEGKTVVRMLGFNLTSTQLLARLGALEAVRASVRDARDPAALDAYCMAVRWVKGFIRDLEAALKEKFGENSPKLRTFGISTARGKMGRRRALRRAYAAVATSQARAQAKKPKGPVARTLSEAVALTSGLSAKPAPSQTGGRQPNPDLSRGSRRQPNPDPSRGSRHQPNPLPFQGRGQGEGTP